MTETESAVLGAGLGAGAIYGGAKFLEKKPQVAIPAATKIKPKEVSKAAKIVGTLLVGTAGVGAKALYDINNVDKKLTNWDTALKQSVTSNPNPYRIYDNVMNAYVTNAKDILKTPVLGVPAGNIMAGALNADKKHSINLVGAKHAGDPEHYKKYIALPEADLQLYMSKKIEGLYGFKPQELQSAAREVYERKDILPGQKLEILKSRGLQGEHDALEGLWRKMYQNQFIGTPAEPLTMAGKYQQYLNPITSKAKKVVGGTAGAALAGLGGLVLKHKL